MKPTLARKIFCIAALFCAAAWNANANQVADAGFEASADGLGPHPFSASWTSVDPSGFQGVGGDSAFAHTGNNYAFLGATGTIGSLSQSISTVAGQSYNLSFWLANDRRASSEFVRSVLEWRLRFFPNECQWLPVYAVWGLESPGHWRIDSFRVPLPE